MADKKAAEQTAVKAESKAKKADGKKPEPGKKVSFIQRVKTVSARLLSILRIRKAS